MNNAFTANMLEYLMMDVNTSHVLDKINGFSDTCSITGSLPCVCLETRKSKLVIDTRLDWHEELDYVGHQVILFAYSTQYIGMHETELSMQWMPL